MRSAIKGGRIRNIRQISVTENLRESSNSESSGEIPNSENFISSSRRRTAPAFAPRMVLSETILQVVRGFSESDFGCMTTAEGRAAFPKNVEVKCD